MGYAEFMACYLKGKNTEGTELTNDRHIPTLEERVETLEKLVKELAKK